MNRLMDLAHLTYNNTTIARFLHTTPACLEWALRDCGTVLDLGCGVQSPVPVAARGKAIGVELFERSLQRARAAATHDAFVQADITNVQFAPRCVDAVAMVEVLEHLTKGDGFGLLQRAETWARRRVVITTPNGFVPQVAIEGNPHQAHLSGWFVDELVARGYRAFGLAGVKWIRQENDHDVVQSDRDAMLASIRYRPRQVWLAVSALSQLVTYRVPKLSFGVMYVRDLQ